MKLYFEDGQLKIRVDEEETEQRRKFLHDIYYAFKEWSEKERYVLIVQAESQYKYVIAAAKRHEVEISQEVEDYYQYELQKAQEEEERKQREERRLHTIAQADRRQKNGCGICAHLECVNGHHFCKYAMRACRYRPFDVEYEFECRKEAKAFKTAPTFIAPAYPCAGCYYLEQAEKAWKEMNEEKGNV